MNENTILQPLRIPNNIDKYPGEWYCPVVKKFIRDVDCYEIRCTANGFLKKEALFVKVELDKWDYICDRCTSNPENTA